MLDKLPEFPKIKVTETAFDFYNVIEAASLIEAASKAEERALLRFSLHTGARAGESLALEWSDIDTHSSFVSFSKSRTDGVTTDSTKDGKPRKVPLSVPLLADESDETPRGTAPLLRSGRATPHTLAPSWRPRTGSPEGGSSATSLARAPAKKAQAV
jgi:integrase